MPQLNINQAVDLAVKHQQAGRLAEAEQLYRQVLTREPRNMNALHLLGVILWQSRREEGGLDLIRQAIAIQPGYCEAHFNLGNALRDKGELDEAIAAFRRAIAIKPGFADAHASLGAALQDRGQLDPAIEAYRRAIASNPRHPKAHTSLVAILRCQGRLDEAIDICRKAVAMDSRNPEFQYYLGHALAQKECFGAAIAAYRQTIVLDPNSWIPYLSMAQALEARGDIPEAIAAFKAARERAPAGAVSDYHLAALGVTAAPPAAPRSYVTGLFNDYSARFDHHLVRQLGYKAPQLLFDVVNAAAPPQPLDVIDLGCGTGLCGAQFRLMARRLTGVDLAPRMIEKARERGVYDELIETDITTALKDRPHGVDLILAADVFIYVGRLEEVFQSAAKALRPGGLFAFTIESLDAGDYALRVSRRYAQSLSYIRRLASVCHFTEVNVQPAVLRKELSVPVEGLVIVLRAAGSESMGN